MAKANALGYFSDRSTPSSTRQVPNGGGSTATSENDVEAGGSTASAPRRYDSNQILCISLTAVLILFGIGVSTWYAIEQANADQP